MSMRMEGEGKSEGESESEEEWLGEPPVRTSESKRFCAFGRASPIWLARIGNREVHIELEYNSVSFKAHLPDLRKVRGQRHKLLAKTKHRGDRRPVAILCWLDGDKQRKLTEQVRNLRIFELQTLLREKRKIRI